MPDFINPSTSIPHRTSVTCTFTPAATSHTALDAVGAAQTVTIPNEFVGRTIRVVGYRLSQATTTPVTTTWTAFLFGSTPTVIADDAAFVIATADGAKLLAPVSIIQLVDYGSTWQEAHGIIAGGTPITPPSDTITVYLQNTSTITLEAVAHKLTLFLEI